MNYTYKQIWLINMPVMISLLMEQLINFTDSVFLGHVSQIDLGASALATTTISLVSNLLGAKTPESVLPTCRRVIRLNYATGIPLVLLAFTFSKILLRLFTDDTAVTEAAFYPFCVMLSTFIISVPAYTYCNAVIGTGNTRTAFYIQMINILVYLIYLYELSRAAGIPLAVYWTAEQLYVAVLLGLSYRYLKKGSWRKGVFKTGRT